MMMQLYCAVVVGVTAPCTAATFCVAAGLQRQLLLGVAN